MTTDPRVLQAVHAAVDVLNESRAPELRLTKDPDTVLFGEEGALDSLDLVELVAETEMRIEDDLGVSVSLVSEKALSRRRSPFRSLAALAEYATALVRGEVEAEEEAGRP